MLMSRIDSHRGGAFPPRPAHRPARALPVPADFETVFVKIGRAECETHYGVARFRIDRWLEEAGKDRLLKARAEHVIRLGRNSRYAAFRYGRETVDQWRKEAQPSLTRRDMGSILARSFPVDDPRVVSFEIASAAASFLRISRNGGFRISPTGAGDWWVGLRRRSSADLLDMAKERGFEVPNVTGDGSADIGSA